MTKRKVPLTSGDEYDAFSGKSRSFHNWKSGQIKKLKRAYNKRLRRELTKEINDD
jgi:hypothetical protein